ncbi:MAG: response regulator [Vulcanimicrobiota bacterium]
MQVLYPPHILLLEDDPDLLEMLGDLLQDRGYRVTLASRGADAVEVARQENIDLFIADVRMRGLDGLEALAQARQYQQNVGSLVISGYTSEAETLRALNLEVGGFLKKPFPLDEFIRRVEELLREKERARRYSEGQASLGRGLLWAVERLGQAYPELAGAFERAEKLAQQLGYPAQQARELAAAACLEAGRRQGILQPPEPFLQGEAGHRLLSRTLSFPWDQPADEPAPLPVQLVDAAVRGGLPEAALPELADAYQALAEGRPGPVAERTSGAGLLAVAQTLERTGQHEESEQLFGQLAASQGVSPERVEARLGLVRLALARGDRAAAVAAAGPVAELAAPLGDAFQGRVLLRLGLLLEEPRALARAAQLLATSGSLFEEAQCQVALASLGQGAPEARHLAVLGDPRYTPALGESLHWLLPALLELDDEQARALARRTLARFPRQCGRLLASFETPRRARALEWLARLGSGLPAEVLEPLCEDVEPSLRARAVALAGGAQSESAPLLTVYSLGRFEVLVGEQPIEGWATGKTRYLFALLASQWGRPLTTEAVVEEFWPEHYERGRKSLWQATSAIRRRLREAGLPPEPEALVRQGDTLFLNPELAHWHDLEEFERAYAGDQSSRREALELYQGPYLEGCYMDWALRLREQLEEKVCQTLYLVAEQSLEGAPGEAADYSRRLLKLRPHRQDAAGVRFAALLALNRPQEVLREYERLCRLLRDEYESEPTLDLMRLYHRAQMGLSPEVCS